MRGEQEIPMILSSLTSCPELLQLWSYSLLSISYKVLLLLLLLLTNKYHILSSANIFGSCWLRKTTFRRDSLSSLQIKISSLEITLSSLTKLEMIKETGALWMVEERGVTMPC